MNEQQKTLTYVAIAAVMAVAGITLAPRGPQASKEGLDALIGTEFYKGFKDPAEATSIEVITYDPATATAAPFSVEFKDGLWRIPTRFNYPADAKDRLAKVAASIIGLKREGVVGRTEAEQAEFQVLDPKAEKAENLKGIGNRLTLKKDNTVLADYIIGKQVQGRAGYYYVRKPEEKQTFIAKLDLTLSTKFTDWIESDVLNLDGNKLTQIDIMKHSLEIQKNRPKLVGQEHNALSRKTSSDPWKLEGLDDAAEEVNQDEVRKLVTALDDLKIVGVRPKPESLRKGLEANEGITLDNETEDDMARRGFYFLPTQRGVQMISMEGDMTAGTDQGVEYDMHFGNVFEGSEEDIEKGFLDAATESTDAEPKPDGEKPADDKSSGKKKSRFIFVTARVNPALFGPEPEEPLKPEAPPEQPPAEAPAAPATENPEKKPEETKSEESKSEDSQAKDTKSEEELKDESKAEEAAGDTAAAEDQPTEAAPAEEKPAEPAPTAHEPPKVDPKKAHEEAMKKYTTDKQKYEADVKSRETKLKEAEDKVKTLNARFAEWYYVISAESFENIRQGRSTLVKPKADTESKPEDSTPNEAAPEDAAAPEAPTESNENPQATDAPK